MLNVVESGNMSPRRFAAMHGIDQDEGDSATIETAISRRDKCIAAGLNPDAVFPPASGESTTATAVVTEEGEVEQVEGDVAATAFNGAQVTALSDLATAVTEGSLQKSSAKAIAAAAFPLLTEEQLDAIFDPLVVAPPQAEGEQN